MVRKGAGVTVGGTLPSRRDASTCTETTKMLSTAGGTSQVHQFVALRMLPALEQFEMNVNKVFTFIGLLIEIVQFVGLTLNGNFTWGPYFGGAVARVVYFFNLPFFDSWWSKNTFIAANVCFWAYLVVLAVITIQYLTLIRAKSLRLQQFKGKIGKILLQGFSSVALLPACLLFSSFFVCDITGSTMFWYRDYACGSGYHVTYMVLSIVGMLAALLWSFCATSIIFDDFFESSNIAARATSGPVTCTVLLKAAAAILYNVLLSKEIPEALAPTLCALFFALAIYYAFQLPYYRLEVTRWRVGSLLVVSTFAGVASANVPSTSMWHSYSISTGVVVAASFVMFIVGWFGASIRVNRRYLTTASSLRLSRGTVSEPLFPYGLRINDAVFSRYPNVEAIFLHSAADQQSTAAAVPADNAPNPLAGNPEGLHRRNRGDRNGRGSDEGSMDVEMVEVGLGSGTTDDVDFSILDPYLVYVLFASDVETTTRFLVEYMHYAGTAPTDRMRAFAARIYMKGAAKYRGNAQVAYFFTMFLAVYGNKVRLALYEMENYVLRLEMSMPQEYRTQRLLSRLKAALSMSDVKQSKIIAHAAQLHKEVLRMMSSFWSRLLTPSGDIQQLSVVADHITWRREDCRRTYDEALVSANQTVLVRYSRFLSDVMMEPEAAKLLLERVMEHVEARRLQQMEGAVPISGANGNPFDYIVEHVRASQKDSLSVKGSAISVINTLRNIIVAVFAFLILTAIGFIIFSALGGQKSVLIVDAIWLASETRSWVSYGAFYATELSQLDPTNPADSTRIAEIKVLLLQAAAKIQSSHMKLGQMALRSNYNPLVQHFLSNRIEVLEPGVLSLGGNTSRSITSLFDLGSRVSTSLTDVAQVPAQSALPSAPLEFLVLNAQGHFATAFNSTIDQYEARGDSEIKTFIWVVVVLVMVSILLCALVAGALSVYFHKMEMSKQAMLKLFSLIPRSYVEQLLKTSQERVDRFDKEDREAAAAVEAYGLEDLQVTTELARDFEELHDKGLEKDRISTPSEMKSKAAYYSYDPPSNAHAPSHLRHESIIAANIKKDPDSQKGTNWNSLEEEATGSQAIRYAGILEDNDPEPLNLFATLKIWGDSICSSLTFSVVVILLIVVAMALCLAALGVTYHLYDVNKRLVSSSLAAAQAIEENTKFQQSIDRLVYFAQQYVETGDLVNMNMYINVLTDQEPYRIHRSLVQQEVSPENVWVLVQRTTLLDSIMLRINVALWLASLYYGVSGPDRHMFDSVSALRRPYNFTALQPAVDAVFASFDLIPPPTPATTDAEDVALAASQQLEVAMSLLFDDTFMEHFTLMNRLAALYVPSHKEEVKNLRHEQRKLWIEATVLLSCTLAISVLLACVYYSGNGPLSVWFLLVIGMAVLIAAIAALRIFYDVAQKMNSALDTELAWINVFNVSSNTLFTSQRLPLSYAHFGDLKRRNDWFATTSPSEYNTSLAILTSMLHGSVTRDELPAAVRDVATIVNAIETQKYYGSISLTQGAVVFGTYSQSDLPGSEALQAFDYSRMLESTFQMDLAMFLWNPLLYTNKTTDVTLPTSDLRNVARKTLSGARYYYVASNLYNTMWDIVRQGENTMNYKVAEKVTTLITMAMLSLILAAVIAILFIAALLMALHVATRNLVVNSTFNFRHQDFTSQNGTYTPSSITRHICSAYVGLVILVMLSLALFTLGLYNFIESRYGMKLLGLSTGREWHVMELMLRVQHSWYSTPAAATVSPYRQAIESAFASLVELRSDFYIGANYVGMGVIWSIPSQVETLFGTSKFKGKELLEPCLSEPLVAGRYSVQQLIDNGIDATTEVIEAMMGSGVENVVWEWMMSCLHMLDISPPSLHLSYRSVFLSVVPSLFTNLHTSSSEYFSSTRNHEKNLMIVSICLSVAYLLLVVFLLFCVMLPIVEHMKRQGNGTVAMLKMIPASVQRDVPALMEFFETGSLNENIERINQACRDTSTTSLIVIDSDGIVLQASREMLQRFQYTAAELIGANVSILMPDDVAALHDGYLKRYHQTGVGRMVSRSNRVLAKRKDNTTFLVEVTIREVQVNEVRSLFVGRIRSIAVKAELEEVKQIQRCLMEVSRIPIVVISTKGIIQTVNVAACSTFLYRGDEMVGRNVRMLMPERIAQHHDSYLERCMTSKDKVAVDVTRKVTGLRKTGEEIQLETAIRQLEDEHGKPLLFIGYLRDITSDLLVTQSALASEAAIQMSWIPVVGIDTTGNITIFSPAAEESWGWKASEVIGKNVRMLMNDEDGRRHDMFLAQYMRTGIKHFIGRTRSALAKRKNGEEFFVEASVRELRKDDEITFCGYLRDLTTELETTARNTLSSAIFNAAPTSIIVINEKGIVHEFNPAAARQLGYRQEEIVGQNIKMLLPDAIAEKHDGYLQRYLATGIKTVIDDKRREYAKRSDGRLIMVELSVQEIWVDDLLAEAGKRRMYVGTLRDFSEEHLMKRANALNDVVTDLCVVPMISMTSKGIIRTVNHAAEMEFGYSAEDVVGKNVSIIMPERIAVKHDQYLRNYRKAGAVRFPNGVNHTFGRRSDGAEFPIEIRVIEVKKKELLSPILIASIRNTSQEVELENALITESAIIDAFPQGIVVTNISGRIIKFSDEATRIFGWSENEVLGRSVNMLFVSETQEKHDAAIKAYMKSKVHDAKPWNRELCGIRQDGTMIRVDVTMCCGKQNLAKGALGSSVLNAGGDVTVLCFIRDLTSETTLHQSQELRDAVIKNFVFPLVELRKDGVIITGNMAFLSEFRFRRLEDAVGRNIEDVVGKPIAREYDKFVLTNLANHEVRSTGFLFTKESPLNRCNGSSFPATYALRTLRRSYDTPSVVLCFIRNMESTVSARIRKSLGETIVEATPVPLVMFSKLGTIQRLNRAAQKLFEYSFDELIGKSAADLQPKGVRVQLMDLLMGSHLAQSNSIDHSLFDSTGNVMSSCSDTPVSSVGPSSVRNSVSAEPPAAPEEKGMKAKKIMSYALRREGGSFQAEFVVHALPAAASEEVAFVVSIFEMSNSVQLTLANEVQNLLGTMCPHVFFTVDMEGGIVNLPERAAKLLGVPPASALGKGVGEYLTPESVPIYEEAVAKVKATTPPPNLHSVRVHCKRGDGTSFPAEMRMAIITANLQSPLQVCFVRDITTEMQFTMAAQINSRMINLLVDAFVAINETGIVEDINVATTRIFGYTRDEVVGRNIKLLMPRTVGEFHDMYLRTYLETGNRRILNGRSRVMGRHKNGTEIPIELSISELNVHGTGGRTFYGFLRDCSEEEDLHYENEVSNIISDMNDQPVMLLSGLGSILRFSRGSEKLFGYHAEEMKQRHISMLFPIQNEQKVNIVQALLTKMSDGGHNMGEMTIKGRRKNGSVLDCILRLKESSVIGEMPTFLVFVAQTGFGSKDGNAVNLADAINSLDVMPTIQTDDQGTILSVTESALSFLKYTSQDLVGNNVEMLIPENQLKSHDPHFLLFTSNSNLIGQTRRVTVKPKNGLPVQTNVTITAISIDSAQQNFLCFFQDLSEDIMVENSHRMTKAVLGLSPSPIFVFNAEGTVTAASVAATEEIGVPIESIVGQPLSKIMTLQNYISTERRRSTHETSQFASSVEGISLSSRLIQLAESARSASLDDRGAGQLAAGMYEIFMLRQSSEATEPGVSLQPRKMTVTELLGADQSLFYMCFISPPS